MNKTRIHRLMLSGFAAVTAMALPGGGNLLAQTSVNIELNPTTYNAGNSTDSYQISKDSLDNVTLSPSEAASQAAHNVFQAAVNGLNGNSGVPGSAENLQAARAALDADPANPALQEALARSQAQYNQYLTTISNLHDVVTVGDDVEINTFNGVSGAPIVKETLDPSEGAIQKALEEAQKATTGINEAVDYYKEGAGASTIEEIDGDMVINSYADLEGGVISKIQPLAAGTVGPAPDEYNNEGFKNETVDAYNDTATDLAAAHANYEAVIADPASTSAEIALAAGQLAAAETLFAQAVEGLYDNFTPLTDTAKNELLGAVLNGSWERDAILSNNNAILTNAQKLDDEIDERSSLIRRETNSNGDEVIHIGENSLVTGEVGGQQLLYAEDGGGDGIDIRISNPNAGETTNLIVDGSTTTGTLGVTGNASVGGDLTVDGDVQFNQDLTVAGTTTTGDLVVNNDATIGGDLTVDGDVQFNQDLTVAGTTTTEDLVVNNDATIGGDLTVDGDVQFNQDLTVAGTTTTGDLVVNNDATIGGDLTVDGEVTLNDRLTVGDLTTLNGGVVVHNGATFNGLADFNDGVAIQNGLNVTGGATVDTLTVTGDAAVGGRLDVADDVYVGGRATGLQAGLDQEIAIRAAEDIAIRNELQTTRRGLQSQLDDHSSRIARNTRGIAMVAAMTQSTVLPGNTNALDFNAAYFEGKAGFALSYSRKINESVQLNFATATTNDAKEVIVRGGVGVQW